MPGVRLNLQCFILAGSEESDYRIAVHMYE